MKQRFRLAAALGVLCLVGLAGPGQTFEIPKGDASETEFLDGRELGAPAALEAVAPPPVVRVRDARIQRAWSSPATSLAGRVARTRREAVSSGVWSVDAAARAALHNAEGDSLERARAAVLLAPDLPAAHMALASARWLQGEDPIAAVWSVVDALSAATRHPEGAVWLLGSGLLMLALCLLGAGLVTLVGSGLAALAQVAHDFGHLLMPAAPQVARVALVCALLLVPLLAGEGLLGLALGMLALAAFRGGGRSRLVLATACTLMGLAAFPLAQLAGRVLSFFPQHPGVAAAYAVAGGSASSLEVARLRAHEDDDLALWALALDARQRGSVGQADAYYQRLLERRGDITAVVNNAANVRLDLGHMESAFSLYDQALDQQESAVVLFNLAQAYGRAFQVDDLNRTLGHAQAVDGELVAKLTALEGSKASGFVADLPVGNALLWRRLLESRHGGGIAAEIRRPLAPGRLGERPLWFAASFGLVWLAFTLLGARFESARDCERCGTRVCPRCDPANIDSRVCTACNRLFYEPEKTDRALRTERMKALARRRDRIDRLAAAASVLIPGAAGLLAHRPVSALVGAFCAALALLGVIWRDGIVTDPLVFGPAVPVLFLGSAALGLLGHVVLVTHALSARREEQT